MSNEFDNKNVKYLNGGGSYVLTGLDDVININTSVGATILYLPNVRNSGFDLTYKNYFINDVANNSSVNPITLVTLDGDKVNGQNAIVIAEDGASVIIEVAGFDQWAADINAVPTPPPVIGGILGISDSQGIYTYYDNYTDAFASASPGQTIEQFADIVETNPITISLVSGVNINMNGHTYTLTGNSPDSCFSAFNVTTNIYNGVIKRDYTGFSASDTISCILYASSKTSLSAITLEGVNCTNVNMSDSNISGSVVMRSTHTNIHIDTFVNYIDNANLFALNGYTSTYSEGYGELWMSNSKIESWGGGLQCGYNLTLQNCFVIVLGTAAIQTLNANILQSSIYGLLGGINAECFHIENSYILGYSGAGLFALVSNDSCHMFNSHVASLSTGAINILGDNATLNLSNNRIESFTSSALFFRQQNSGFGYIMNNTILASNTTGTAYGIRCSATNIAELFILNNVIECYGGTLTSYYISVFPGSNPIYYVDNKLRGIAIPSPLDPALVQKQINTQDNFGNILIG